MYFEIHIDKDAFKMSQDEHDYHEQIISQFKNEYAYAFKYLQHNTPNITIELNYLTEIRKFQFVSISILKYIHDTLIRSDDKIMKWFNY
jgi:hypothetical protein